MLYPLVSACAAIIIFVVIITKNSLLSKALSQTWLVFLDPTHQLDRLMRRNGFTREEAGQRIAAQLPLSEKARRATRIIDNNGDLDALRLEVDRVWAAAGL